MMHLADVLLHQASQLPQSPPRFSAHFHLHTPIHAPLLLSLPKPNPSTRHHPRNHVKTSANANNTASPSSPPPPSPTIPPTDIDGQIFNIAFPTLATLAADPLAALVSVAWVGHLGAKELAGVGVALSVYNAYTKIFNMPLLAVITSSTAQALGRGERETVEQGNKPTSGVDVGTAVTSALALAASIGLLQALLLGVLGIQGLSTWGASPSSPIYSSAVQYLGVRAVGAPATVLFLSLQGAFRGLGDTRAPLVATIASNAINLVLEPIFIFTLHGGVKGAAAAVVVSQLVAVLGLAVVLARKLNLQPPDASVLRESAQYLKPTGLLTLRTLAITATFSVATSLASRTDPVHAAAHQIAFQLWLSSSLLADSLAVAAQSLVARSLATPNPTAANRAFASAVSRRVSSLSLALGVVLSIGLSVSTVTFPLTRMFSSDPAVLTVLDSIMPAVIALQPINALAFTFDGILYGVNGFGYAAQAMAASAAPAMATMLAGARWVSTTGAGPQAQLSVVWAGLAVVMMARFLTIFVPYKLKKKPFDSLFFFPMTTTMTNSTNTVRDQREPEE